MKKWIFLPLAVFIFGGCAGLEQMQKEADSRFCNEDSAYEKGYNGGHEGEKMSSSFADSCASEGREKIVSAYRKGFLEGSQRAASEAPQRIVVTHGEAKRILCTINVFGDKFEAWGESEKEAKWKVSKLCAEKNNEIHCQSPFCQ